MPDDKRYPQNQNPNQNQNQNWDQNQNQDQNWDQNQNQNWDRNQNRSQPGDPQTVVAQQPPGQRHPQQTTDTSPERTGSINEPEGSDTTPWYQPSDRDKAMHQQEQRRNYTMEDQQRRQQETAQQHQATRNEGQARANQNPEDVVEAQTEKQQEERDRLHERREHQ